MEDVPAKARLQNYELDHHGKPILETKQRVPKLSIELSSAMPIMGLPLMHFKENIPMEAKDHSDKMWGLFCQQIVLSANSDPDYKNKMLVTKIIEKFEDVQDV